MYSMAGDHAHHMSTQTPYYAAGQGTCAMPTCVDVLPLCIKPCVADHNLCSLLQDLAQRNIVVKSFTDVPMADVEMIFPEKKVFIKPFVLIQLVVTVVLAAITIFSTLFQVGALFVSIQQDPCQNGYMQCCTACCRCLYCDCL